MSGKWSFLFCSLFFFSTLTRMSFFIHCVDCDLKFDNENAFQRHANSRNPTAAASVMAEEEFVPVPRGLSTCSACVVCLKCQRSYEKLKGYKGGCRWPHNALGWPVLFSCGHATTPCRVSRSVTFLNHEWFLHFRPTVRDCPVYPALCFKRLMSQQLVSR